MTVTSLSATCIKLATEPTRYLQLSTVMYRLCIFLSFYFNRIHILVIELHMTTLLIKKCDDDDDDNVHREP